MDPQNPLGDFRTPTISTASSSSPATDLSSPAGPPATHVPLQSAQFYSAGGAYFGAPTSGVNQQLPTPSQAWGPGPDGSFGPRDGRDANAVPTTLTHPTFPLTVPQPQPGTDQGHIRGNSDVFSPQPIQRLRQRKIQEDQTSSVDPSARVSLDFNNADASNGLQGVLQVTPPQGIPNLNDSILADDEASHFALICYHHLIACY